VGLLTRLRSIATSRRLDDEITREIDAHIAMEIEHRQKQGLTPEEARRTALRDFGGVGRVREEVRDMRGMTIWDAFSQDLKFGVRTLRRSPGYTLAAVSILALGIGANTAIFSVIDGVLLKPLPFRNGDELILVQQSLPAQQNAPVGVAIPELFDYRKRSTTVKELVEYHRMSFVLLNQGEPDRVDTAVVSANFFDMLGVRPLHGRSFNDKDDDLGSDAVLMLSNGYWKQKFGGDPNVIGKVLEMNNRVHTVVGVLPDYPQYPAANDVYMPTSACPFRASAEQNLPGGHRSFGALNVFGRLAPGATAANASAELNALGGSFEKDFARDYTRLKGLAVQAAPLQDQLVVGARPMLLALGGTTILVLMIACANVANLSLARTMRRRRELALRTALGADRGRLLRQLVTESVIVAVAGGLLGIGIAWLTLDMLTTFVGRFTARTGQISIDTTVLIFTLAISVVTGVIFGVAPALAGRRNTAQAMRDGAAQAGEGAGKQRLRAALVAAQVAVSFMLLVGAALLLKSFMNLEAVNLGYDGGNRVMTAAIFGNFTRTQTTADAERLHTEILERLRNTPGVINAAATNSVPLQNLSPGRQPIRIEGRTNQNSAQIFVDPNVASTGYFETLRVPVLRGRPFSDSDSATAPPVAVINQTMAKYWEGVDPVGTRFVIDVPVPPGQPEQLPFTVVGVVADFKLYNVDQPTEAQYYVPYTQGGNFAGRLLVRTAGDARDLIPAIKDAVHRVDPQTPVEDLLTLEELRYGRLRSPELTAGLLSIFAGIALLITLAGLAGVIGTSVSQRTREFGLRMALGASRISVLRLVLGQGVMMVAIGLVAGIGGAWAFSRLIERYLFNTPPTDIGAYAVVAAIFFAAAVIAALGPARRATSIDPLSALRAE